jgi:fused signal recognition particle receptor
MQRPEATPLAQAREFHQTIGLTGLIVTKFDGSGKGGIVIAIQDELGLPTRFVGTGEKLDDLLVIRRARSSSRTWCS